MSNLEDPLLDRQRSFTRIFAVKKEELSSWFEGDAIREGYGLNRIKDLGGVEGLLQKLQTSEKKGLNSEDDGDLAARKHEFDRNDPIIKPPKTLWELITVQFEDEMLRILSAAAAVSLILGVIEHGLAEGWLEGFAIFVAVILIVSVTAGNNYLRDQQFRKLNSKREQRDVAVVRNGEVTQLNVFNLLVGDIMMVSIGENIPVDGLCLRSNNLVIDESSVTGESDPIKKVPTTFKIPSDEKHMNSFLISGSKVMDGTGLMLVCAVGVNSQQGKTKMRLTEEIEQTPLQAKLEGVVDQIGNIGKWAAYLTFGGMTLHLLYDIFIGGLSLDMVGFLEMLVDFFIIGVTIIVVAIPEGLPLAVTLALAYSVGKMKDENNLVRHLSACETMGGANNICTDKTGTLTLNIMSVESLYIEDQTMRPLVISNISKETQKVFSEAVSINSDAYPKKLPTGSFEQIGNKTECALLELASKFGYDYLKYRNDNIIRQIPFSSERKRMTSVYRHDDKSVKVYVKGATEVLLERSTTILLKDGKTMTLDEQKRATIMNNVVSPFAKGALRTIAICYKEIRLDNRNIDAVSEEELGDKLTLVCIAGIMDPLRSEIPGAVRKCKDAGITVRMVTGDIPETAVSIAVNAGILSPGQVEEKATNPYIVMDGKTFRAKVGGIITEKDEEGNEKTRVKDLTKFKEIADSLRVLARCSPDDKYTLVTGLKQLGHVVAVTGDGTNDAPALKKADVGFAMGIMGTEVAKEAAGIIILDDNFNSLVVAVKWGRNIFDCIRKFLQFQLTVNVVAISMVFLGGVILRESPFTPIQMLWVNLIMDTFASMALATEPPKDELLKRMPYKRNENFITPVMWRNVLGQSVYQIVVLIVILWKGDTIFGVPSGRMNTSWTLENGVHYTILFNTFVFMQAFNEINARKLKTEEVNVFEDFLNNPMFLFIEILTIIVQVMFVEIGGKALRCSPLTFNQHICCILIGAGSLVVGVLIKKLPESFFGAIPLLDRQITIDKLKGTTQSSLRRDASQKYKHQGSLR